MSRCLLAPELVAAARYFDLHRDKVLRQNRNEIAAELGKHLGRLVTVANVDTALDASGLGEEWRAAQKTRKRVSTATAAKRSNQEKSRRLAALEAAFVQLCRELGIDGAAMLASCDSVKKEPAV